MPANVWSLAGMLAFVILILALAYGTTRWLASHHPGGFPGKSGTGGSEGFTVLGQIGVGRNERLVLLRLQGHCLLLGVTEHEITLLKDLEGEETEGLFRQAQSTGGPSFLEVLSENLRRKK